MKLPKIGEVHGGFLTVRSEPSGSRAICVRNVDQAEFYELDGTHTIFISMHGGGSMSVEIKNDAGLAVDVYKKLTGDLS